jgi:hypothetical protein
MINGRSHWTSDRTVPSGSTIDTGGCYLGSPLGEGAVTIPKAVHRPPNRGNSNQTLLANAPSVALATGLGYQPYATHLAVQLTSAGAAA